MAIQITIIGLGQIGTSIGLALADHPGLITRVGHDRDLTTARQAEKSGALDRVEANLPKSVRNADLVLLSIPIDQIRETMSLITPDLKEGCVVMDTGPIKEVVTDWANELLGEGRFYIGLTPVINPAYLHAAESGLEAARADLFHSGLMAIIAPPSTNSDALKLAADLTRLLGGTPLFADPMEIDGLMAATHILPQLMAAALLNATIDQPGWREGRKLAGKAYAEATAPIVHLGESQTVKESVVLNQENVLRVLDSAIAALQTLRNDVKNKDEEALGERLERARHGRQKWWSERLAGGLSGQGIPQIKMPESPGVIGRLFGIRAEKKKPK